MEIELQKFPAFALLLCFALFMGCASPAQGPAPTSRPTGAAVVSPASVSVQTSSDDLLKINMSQTYWSGALPFSIANPKVNSSSVSFLLSEDIFPGSIPKSNISITSTITDILFSSKDGVAGNITADSLVIHHGEARNVSFSLINSPCKGVAPGSLYDLQVEFIYSDRVPSGTVIDGLKMDGSRPLVGLCS